MPLTVVCDVDDVLVHLIPAWLKRYNEDYQDSVTPEQIKDWDITRFLMPECGKDIYQYLDEGTLYDEAEMVDGALEGVETLRSAGHRVVFVTNATVFSARPKFEWMQRHHFLPDTCTFHEDFETMVRKWERAGDVLIDDKISTCEAWARTGRPAILFPRAHNAPDVYTPTHENIVRARNWAHVVEMVAELADRCRVVAKKPQTAVSEMPDETILQEAQRLVHGNRGADYGHPIEDYTRTGRMWGAILGIGDIDPRVCCLMMAVMKVSREVNKHKRDNLTDLAGYAECASMVAQRQAGEQ